MQYTPNDSEIDLYGMLSKLWRALTAPLRLWRFGLVALVAGIALGSLHYYTTPKRYSGTVILSGNDLATDQTMVLLLDELNKLCISGAQTQLAERLNIGQPQAALLISIAAREVKDLPTNPYPSEREAVVEVQAASDSVVAIIGPQLVYYLEHTPALSELKHTRQESHNFALSNLLGQLRQMDSTVRNNPQAASTYAQMADHQARITALREDMARNKISLLKDSNKPQHPSWPRLWWSLAIAIAISYALCALWLIRKP